MVLISNKSTTQQGVCKGLVNSYICPVCGSTSVMLSARDGTQLNNASSENYCLCSSACAELYQMFKEKKRQADGLLEDPLNVRRADLFKLPVQKRQNKSLGKFYSTLPWILTFTILVTITLSHIFFGKLVGFVVTLFLLFLTVIFSGTGRYINRARGLLAPDATHVLKEDLRALIS